MKVLVTGALGVNGPWVVRELLERGHEVLTFDLTPATEVPADLAGRIEHTAGDVRDLDALRTAMESVEVLVHMAAVIQGDVDLYRGYGVNAAGSVTAFEAARLAGVRRIVFTSAKAIYGSLADEFGNPEYRPVRETHAVGVCPGLAVYSACKMLAEAAGRRYAQLTGVEFAALRFATIFGPGKQARHGGIGALSRIVEGALAGEPFSLPSGSEERDELIYVGDAARAVAITCEVDALPDDTFNFGGGIFVGLPEYAAAVSENVAPAQVEIGPGLDPFGLGRMYGRLDWTRAERTLGFTPRFGLAEGLRHYAAALGGHAT
jgi:UDP-glucose 4-epimerase